jgi:hypothetical protein
MLTVMIHVPMSATAAVICFRPCVGDVWDRTGRLRERSVWSSLAPGRFCVSIGRADCYWRNLRKAMFRFTYFLLTYSIEQSPI